MSINNLFTNLNGNVIPKMDVETWSTLVVGGGGGGTIDNVIGTANEINVNVANSIATVSLPDDVVINNLTIDGNMNLANFVNPWPAQQPAQNGYVLSSQTNGVLGWVENSVGVASLTGVNNQTVVNQNTGAVTLGLANQVVIPTSLSTPQLTVTGNNGNITNPFVTATPPNNNDVLGVDLTDPQNVLLKWVPNGAGGAVSSVSSSNNNISTNQTTGDVILTLSNDLNITSLESDTITSNGNTIINGNFTVNTGVVNLGDKNCFSVAPTGENQVLTCDNTTGVVSWIDNTGTGTIGSIGNTDNNVIITNPTGPNVTINLNTEITGIENINVTLNDTGVITCNTLSVLGDAGSILNPFLTSVLPLEGQVISNHINGTNYYLNWSDNVSQLTNTDNNLVLNNNSGSVTINLNPEIESLSQITSTVVICDTIQLDTSNVSIIGTSTPQSAGLYLQAVDENTVNWVAGTGGGGVTQITAGLNIGIDPVGGVGNVTIQVVDQPTFDALTVHTEANTGTIFTDQLIINGTGGNITNPFNTAQAPANGQVISYNNGNLAWVNNGSGGGIPTLTSFVPSVWFGSGTAVGDVTYNSTPIGYYTISGNMCFFSIYISVNGYGSQIGNVNVELYNFQAYQNIPLQTMNVTVLNTEGLANDATCINPLQAQFISNNNFFTINYIDHNTGLYVPLQTGSLSNNPEVTPTIIYMTGTLIIDEIVP